MKPANYIVRDIDGPTFKRFKARAAKEEITMKAIFHLLITGYAHGEIAIRAANVPVPPATTNPELESETITNG